MRRRTVLPVLLVLLTVGCIHKNTPVTPWEKVATYNAVLAQTNNTVEQGAEAAAFDNVFTHEVATEVIQYTQQVAVIHLQVTALLAKGSALTSHDTASVSALLQQIQASGTTLVNSGKIGIKNPKTQNTIAGDITSIVSAAQAIMGLIPALVANPAPPPVSNFGSSAYGSAKQ